MGISEIALGVMAAVGAGTSVAGGITQAQGAKTQAAAQAQAATYNSEIETQNAIQANRNAALAMQSGEQSVGIVGQQNRATMGAIKANEAASGIDINSGSFSDVQQSAREVGQLNALTERSNAVKAAYGYNVQAQQFEEEAKLGVSQAGYAEQAGSAAAAGSILGGVGNATTNYLRYLQSSGIGGGSPENTPQQFSFQDNLNFG